MTLKRLFKWSAATLFLTGLIKSSQFILIMYSSTTLSLSEFATFNLMFAFLTGISAFSSCGIFEDTMAKFARKTGKQTVWKLHSEQTNLFFGQSLFYLLIFFALYQLFYSLGNIYDTTIFICCLIIGTSFSFGVIQGGIMRLANKNLEFMFFYSITQLPTLITMLISAYLFKNNYYIFLFGALTASCSFLGIIHIYRKRIELNLSAIKFEQYKLNFPYHINAAIGWMSGYGMNLIVFLIFDDLEVAKLSLYLTLSSIIFLVSNSMNIMWSSYFSNNYFNEDNRTFLRTSGLFFTIHAGVMAFLSIVIVISTSYIGIYFPNLEIYFKNPFELFLVLCPYIALTVVYQLTPYFQIEGEPFKLMKVHLYSGLCGFFTWFLLTNIFNVDGFYFGFLALALCQIGLILQQKNNSWNCRVPYTKIFAIFGLSVAVVIVFIRYFK